MIGLKLFTGISMALVLASCQTSPPVVSEQEANRLAGAGSSKLLRGFRSTSDIPVSSNVFSKKLSDREVEDIVKDGKPHRVGVLFDDSVKIRVVQAHDGARISNDGKGIASKVGNLGAEAEVRGALAGWKFRTIDYLYASVASASETELEEDQRICSERLGVSAPNVGSYVVLDLDEYSAKNIVGVVSSIRSCSSVRSVFVSQQVDVGAQNYVQPPPDSVFAQGPNWRQYDYSSGGWWWNRHSIGGAWTRANRGNGAKVAIIDNGFELTTHDQLPYDLSLARGYYHDWTGQHYNTDIYWVSGVQPGSPAQHGTMCASLLAAGSSAGSVGSAGAAPNVSLVPIKVNGDSFDLANAIRYASYTGVNARVVSISWWNSSSGHSLEYDDACRPELALAAGRNVTCVIISGNAGIREDYDANKFTRAVMVGAIDRDNNRWSNSSYGTRVDLAASGTDMTIDSFNAIGGFEVQTGWSGTSLAAPIVAGAAAMVSAVMGVNGFNPDAIRGILIGTGDVIHTDQSMASTYGVSDDGTTISRSLNADAAVTVAQMYDPSKPYTVYMPTCDDDAEICDSTWVPKIYSFLADFKNIYYNFAGGQYAVTRTWNSGGAWSTATTVFHDRRVIGMQVTGTCMQVTANGAYLSYPANPANNLAGPYNTYAKNCVWWLP